MLKLRTILLQDKLYYLIFLLVVLITIVNVSIPRSSVYNSNMTEVTGKIISITIEGNKLKLILKNKEKHSNLLCLVFLEFGDRFGPVF